MKLNCPCVVVVDDEAPLRMQLANLLREAGVDRVISVGDAAQCLEHFGDGANPPGWAFLDVRMPGVDGLALADMLVTIRAKQARPAPAIVFVADSGDSAVQTFERDNIDYLLKPVNRARLAAMVHRLAERDVQAEDPGPASYPRTEADPGRSIPVVFQRLPVRTDYSIRMLDAQDIIAATATDERAEIITKYTSYSTYYTLAELEQRLPSHAFCRVHESWIVNLASIVEVQNVEGKSYQVRLASSDYVAPVSPLRLPQLYRLLGL